MSRRWPWATTACGCCRRAPQPDLVRIDPATNEVAESFPAPSGGHGRAGRRRDRSGSRRARTSQLVRVDPATGEEQAVIDVAPEQHLPGGRRGRGLDHGLGRHGRGQSTSTRPRTRWWPPSRSERAARAVATSPSAVATSGPGSRTVLDRPDRPRHRHRCRPLRPAERQRERGGRRGRRLGVRLHDVSHGLAPAARLTPTRPGCCVNACRSVCGLGTRCACGPALANRRCTRARTPRIGCLGDRVDSRAT